MRALADFVHRMTESPSGGNGQRSGRAIGVIGIPGDRRDDDPAVLVFTPVARTAVCFATNKANPVPAITRADFQALAAGRLTSRRSCARAGWRG